jgi:hypothetical protein
MPADATIEVAGRLIKALQSAIVPANAHFEGIHITVRNSRSCIGRIT